MIVSIDIGTSYSSLSMIGPEGKPVPVTIGEGGTAWGDKVSLPSAVFVEENGNILVGQAAMRSRLRKPECFRMEFKRNLGEDTPLLLGGRSFRVEELYTELLLHMKACVKRITNEDIELAYLTCPATYRKDKKERLISAAKAAGLFQVELVPEPTAAAMSYVSAGYVKDGQTLLVYDFGGGTFDAALIEYKDGSFLPLGEPLGLPRCGGIDMDRLIYQDMMKAVDPDTLAMLQKKQEYYLSFAAQLSENAVQIKHQLSSAQTATWSTLVGWDQLEYTLTRQTFEQMIAPMIDQTIHVCEDALTSAGLEKSGLSAVVLVGGTSRVPLVQQMVQQFAGKVPVYAAPDVDLAVVQGALSYRQYNSGALAEKWYQDAKKLDEQGGSPEEIVDLYRKAAEQGYAAAQYNLGVCYDDGIGVEHDHAEAAKWYRKAAEQGDANAQYELGVRYYYGTGVGKDYAEAAKWYRKAAEQGQANAQYNLGCCYEHGKGVLRDDTEAAKWYRKAAEQGYSDAKKRHDMLVNQSEPAPSGSVTVSYKTEEKPTTPKSEATILALVEKGRKSGFIDQTGKLVIPYMKWFYVWPFSEGLACVGNSYDSLGFIDKTGKLVIPHRKWEHAEHFFSEGLTPVSYKRWGGLVEYSAFINKSGNTVISGWDRLDSFSEGLAPASRGDKSGYHYGYINKLGELVIPCQWDKARLFFEGLARVEKWDKWGYIVKTGKLVIPCRWDNAFDFSEGLAWVQRDGKWGVIDKTGNEVIPCKWGRFHNTKVRKFVEGLSLVRTDGNGKYGYIDKSGNVVIPCQWDDADNFSEGLALVVQDGKYGYIDKSGKLIIPCQWDDAGCFSEGLAKVKKDGKYGFINKAGELVIPCQWDNAWGFRNSQERFIQHYCD